MSYLLDTNAVIAVITGRQPAVRTRLDQAVRGGENIGVSAIVLYELRHGVAKSTRAKENAERLQIFLSGGFSVLPFEEEDAELSGDIRAKLEAVGKPIGPYDLLIAAQAVRRDATLVTANTTEFRRVPGLKVSDWAKAR